MKEGGKVGGREGKEVYPAVCVVCVCGEGLPKRCTWVCKVGGTLLKQFLRWRLWVWELVHVPGMGMELILCVPAMKMGQATTGETSTIQNISKLEDR